MGVQLKKLTDLTSSTLGSKFEAPLLSVNHITSQLPTLIDFSIIRSGPL